MAFVHGKDTVIKLGANDLSEYTTTSELNRSADTHDVTTYGKGSHVYQGGLKDGKATMSGVYDNTAVSGPRAVIEPLLGTTTQLTRQTEGTGAGKPQDLVDVVINGYVETNPVADMVTWSCEMVLSDDVNTAVQV
jgi:hypothetical protein